VALVTALAAAVRWFAPATAGAPGAVDDILINVFATAGFVVVVLAALRAGREWDTAAGASIRAVRREAAALATATERRRAELLAHDEVLHTLRAISVGEREGGPSLRSLAAQTRTSLDALDVDAPADDLDSHELVQRLRHLTTTLAPDARILVGSMERVVIPAVAATALLDASGEALRNSVAHAGHGRPVARTVEVTGRDGGVTITIRDDGRGFDPATVSDRRLGVSGSITGRMAALPSGTSAIRSTPGEGTVVQLGWRP
jgi:hypothetical protein